MSIPGFVLIFFVGCPVVVAVASGVGYAMSRVLIRINWIRPSRMGDTPAEQARHRAVQILQLHLTRSAAGYVIAFVVFVFVSPILVPISFIFPAVLSLLGVIEDSGFSELGFNLAILFAMAIVHGQAQVIAYWLSVRHAQWLA